MQVGEFRIQVIQKYDVLLEYYLRFLQFVYVYRREKKIRSKMISRVFVSIIRRISNYRRKLNLILPKLYSPLTYNQMLGFSIGSKNMSKRLLKIES